MEAPFSLDDWIARDTIPFGLDASMLDPVVDRIIAALDDSIELLGLGEALHGGEDILVLRNRMFERLVATHGFTAIALESSFPRGRLVDDYVHGRRDAASDVWETGFSHGFGKLETTRELVEWMRQYNADPAHLEELSFYGFDAPTEMTSTDSPRQLLLVALDYLRSFDTSGAVERHQRIEELLGDDAAWSNPAAMMDPSKAIGGSPAASALRLETEELITQLRLHQPEPEVAEDEEPFADAMRHAEHARQLLTYHAGLARPSPQRTATLLGIRDLMMADNLAHIVARERRRGGKVLAFAHNAHLQYGAAQWQLGPDLLKWFPAGAHLRATLVRRYAVIGTGVGVSEANDIGQPEPDTLEARLIATPGPARFIRIPQDKGFAAEGAGLPTRSGSTKNFGYFPLAARSLSDFDALIVLDSTTYSRGGPKLP